jgi:hypothetical protein
VAVIVRSEAETNTANNRDDEPTSVRPPSVLLPPAAVCPALTVPTYTLSVGKRSAMTPVVTPRGKRVPGVRVLARGAGILKSGVSDQQGW